MISFQWLDQSCFWEQKQDCCQGLRAFFQSAGSRCRPETLRSSPLQVLKATADSLVGYGNPGLDERSYSNDPMGSVGTRQAFSNWKIRKQRLAAAAILEAHAVSVSGRPASCGLVLHARGSQEHIQQPNNRRSRPAGVEGREGHLIVWALEVLPRRDGDGWSLCRTGSRH